MTRAGLCFDATGTLIETTAPVGEVYRRVALDFGVDLPAWRLDDAFRRVLRHAPTRGLEGNDVPTRVAGEVAWWSERIRQTFQATDSTVRFADFDGFARALFDAYRAPGAWRLRPGVGPLLASLRRRGHPMAVVSDFDHRLPKILQDLEIDAFFDHVEIPSRSGRTKPDRAIFEAAAAALGRPLGGLVYLGDDPPEVLEAIAAHGLRVVPVDDGARWTERLLGLLRDDDRGDTATLPPTRPEVASPESTDPRAQQPERGPRTR